MQSVVERNGETRALFPTLLWVFLAALGELLLHMQPGAYKDALKSTDKALQMFSSSTGWSEIGLVGKEWLLGDHSCDWGGSKLLLSSVTEAASFRLCHFLFIKPNLVFFKQFSLRKNPKKPKQ